LSSVSLGFKFPCSSCSSLMLFVVGRLLGAETRGKVVNNYYHLDEKIEDRNAREVEGSMRVFPHNWEICDLKMALEV
jgi:hypothetical protein